MLSKPRRLQKIINKHHKLHSHLLWLSLLPWQSLLHKLSHQYKLAHQHKLVLQFKHLPLYKHQDGEINQLKRLKLLQQPHLTLMLSQLQGMATCSHLRS
jgi:cytochrome c oxidase assembly factor CtaG